MPLGKRAWSGRGYTGTADAVRQNLESIPRDVRDVLVLPGHLIHSMDYRPLLEFHRQKRALLIVCAGEAGLSKAGGAHRSLGLVSMGIYLFKVDFLKSLLQAEGANDFADHILPAIL